ncbi:pyrimidine dimer DNA glycosylase/endonuclease V [Microbacterium sp. KUDC0406]|uniref:pyrimidine dimer DNA glycosylase/endonuclease V n=1 Tax=Microbacterium sp. KUDC0406 TaxID=2909588 RepID=UPI001F22E0FB|nr:pyrimidine dimer DNA glycosylase/endonuclease V [Microbacterium sp. KUDC0406]UJP11182.1 pyrimidine dimer DNA glycosylase/endonuclease V [Microbacterium sp. KUDC0406]
MRLWSPHPRYLDRQALVACWREALLAQAVLAERTTGYRNHPQLLRFRDRPDPLGAVGMFLTGVADEADARGYRFDRARIDVPGRPDGSIEVTSGQLVAEWRHLMVKLAQRSPERLALLADVRTPDPHPLFVVVPGGTADWERAR